MQEIHYEIVTTENPIGIEHCVIAPAVVHGREHDVTLHWHNALEMTLVQKGGIQYMVEGKLQEAREGEFLFINSGAIHLTRNISDTEEIQALVMLLPDTFLEELVPEVSRPYFTIPEHSSVREIIATYMWQIDTYIKHPQPFLNLLIRKELISIVYQLFSKCYVENRSDKAKDSVCKQVVAYTRQHYTEELSLKEVAAHFHLQENYFCRYFKKGTGMSYHQFVSQLRLQSALSHLAAGNRSETECALEAGFSSVKLLIDWCKRIYCCTPQQYIKQNGKAVLQKEKGDCYEKAE